MKQVICLTLTAVGLLVSASASTEPASAENRLRNFPPFTEQARPLQQQCWLEHAQVQPSPLPSTSIAGNLAVGGPKVWNPPGGRPGSEHWNVADLQRACRSQWNRRAVLLDSAADSFLSNP